MIDLILPWPPKELSPNSRGHWSKKSKAAKAYRAQCHLITMALATDGPRLAGKKQFTVTFCPPSRRNYDDDNLLSRFKAGRDGVADGLGIDDKNFVTTVLVGEPVKGGAVHVSICEFAVCGVSA